MNTLYVTTSWDDGHPSDLRVAELLEHAGLPGTFYIPRAWQRQTLDPARIASRGPHLEVGGHTINHAVLTQTPDDQARKEIIDARRWIEDSTNRPCTVFCPPRGKFQDKHLAMVRDAGYSGYRTVELWSGRTPRIKGGLLEMPTTVQAYPIHRAGHLRNAAKRRSASNALTFLRYGWRRDWAAGAKALFERMLTTGGVFHLWGHSWELDEADQWAALQGVLERISQHAGQFTALTNGQLVERFATGVGNK